MKYIPSKSTVAKAAAYGVGAVALGALVGVPYFGYMATSAAGATTFGAAAMATWQAIASFSAVQLGVATAYGTAGVSATYAFTKAAQYVGQSIWAKLPSFKKAVQPAPDNKNPGKTEPESKQTKPASPLPEPATPKDQANKAPQPEPVNLSTPSKAFTPTRGGALTPESSKAINAEISQDNIVVGKRSRKPSTSAA